MRYVLMGSAAVWSNWDTIEGVFDRFDQEADEPIYGYYLQTTFQMNDAAGGPSARETGVFGMHWINTTGGDLDTTWTAADFASVEGPAYTFLMAIASQISNQVDWAEWRWYAFGPGVTAPNPPKRVTPIPAALTGTSNQPWAHQLASTITFRTALRRHWGRIYMPIVLGAEDTNGQLSDAHVDSLCNAARTYLTAPGTSNGVVPVVYDRNRHAALSVMQLEVDSVPDIIRRRRPRSTRYRKLISA